MYMHECLGTSEKSCSTFKKLISSRKSKQWTESQTEILLKTFQASAYAYSERKELDQLADSFSVSRKKVENWFTNKRRNLARRMSPPSE